MQWDRGTTRTFNRFEELGVPNTPFRPPMRIELRHWIPLGTKRQSVEKNTRCDDIRYFSRDKVHAHASALTSVFSPPLALYTQVSRVQTNTT